MVAQRVTGEVKTLADPNTVAFRIVGAASQTADLIQLRDSTSALKTFFTATGLLDLSAVSATAPNAVAGSVGDKIALYEDTTNAGYGLGIQSGRIVAYVNSPTDGFAVRTKAGSGQKSSGSDSIVAFGNGSLTQTLSSASVVGHIIKATTSQTADLLQIQNVSAQVMAKVDGNGFGVFGGGTAIANALISSTPYGATQVGIAIKLAASATADSFQIYNNANTALFKLSNVGTVQASIGTYSNTGPTLTLGDTGYGISSEGGYLRHWTASTGSGGHLWYAGPNNSSQTRMFLNNSGLLALKGIPSQTANMVELQDNSGTVLGGRNVNGQLWSGSTTPPALYVGGATTAASGDGTTATITTTVAHGFAVGDLVTVTGITPTGYNGTFRVTAVPTTTSYSYANTTTGAQTVAGAQYTAAQASFISRSAATAGLFVRGAASQVNNIFTVQNSGAGTLFYIDSNGHSYVTSGVGFFVNSGFISNTRFAVQGAAASQAVSIFKGYAAQTGNLTEWQDSSGAVQAVVNLAGGIATNNRLTVGSNGTNSAGRLTVLEQTATIIPLVVRAAASQTANLTEWQDSTGAVLARITPSGQVATPFLYSATGVGAYLQMNYDTGSIGVRTADPANKGVVVRAAASQTANLQEWQDSGGVVKSFVGPAGQMGIAGGSALGAALGVLALNASTVGTVIRGVASQTANLQEWQNSAGTILTRIDSTGAIKSSFGLDIQASSTINGTIFTTGLGSTADYSTVISIGAGRTVTINANAANIPLTIRGAASQTNALTSWEDSASTQIARVDQVGSVRAGSFGAVASGNAYMNTAADVGGFRIVTNGASNKGLSIQGSASQTANLQEWQNSSGTVIAGVSAAGFGFFGLTGASAGQVSIQPSSTSTVGLMVRGAASQTANLQEWQNSAGSVLARVTNGGNIVGTAAGYFGSNATSIGGHFAVGVSSSSIVGAIIRGAASQTANLQEWQNSAGTVLSKIDSAGKLTAVIDGGSA